MNVQLFISSTEAGLDSYGLAVRELQCILDQVDEDLFEAELVTDQCVR